MAGKSTGRCQVCRHQDREQIEGLRAAGFSFEALAEKFDLDTTAIWRHWTHHVSDDVKTAYLAGPATIAKLRERVGEESGTLLDYLTITRSVLMGAFIKQAEDGSAFGLATVSGRLLDCLREIGKLTGEISRLNPSIVINNNNSMNITAMMTSQPFLDLQSGLLQIARKHPDARADIVELLRGLDQRQKQPEGSPLIEGRAVA